MTTVNIILGTGTNAVTIQTTKVEEIQANQMLVVTRATNVDSGIPDTLTADLLRVTTRFNVDGKIAYGDRAKFRNLMNVRGTFSMKYDADGDGSEETFNVNFEKFQITEVPRGEHDQGLDHKYLIVKFSVIKAENYESA